ncbi:hypothetical protein A4S05_28330 [Nostoc sp. KVJ20]|uniref:hypothetical protein n=1 Tax=Nostoc sp. KVJ20 TaxID=457944 RepID=UPI00083DD170|nr:hypothetical protein [Nostoc sp. KVJ20]ODH01579.1 hypothetical protein A4S05_28330 [Nostoc sp. KVJ20]
MVSIAEIPPEQFNTWGFVLTANNGLNRVRVIVSLTSTTFKSHSNIAISYQDETWSRNAARDIEQKLAEWLGYLAKPIQPLEFVTLMNQKWAKAYHPQGYYTPSVNISSIVRPYASEDLIPEEVVAAIVDELGIENQEAMRYAKYVHSQIKLGIV